jgi:molybdopterin-containing oxidoreductase family membrane subunit
MIEKLFKATPRFSSWLLSLFVCIVLGSAAYLYQFTMGLSVTGLSRDVSWGFYIAQFTYMVGVAASAVVLVLPAYFHGFAPFRKLLVLGEFMAIAAVVVCMLFIVVDLGQPQRLLNVILHPTPWSIMFWDMLVLSGYLAINLFVGWIGLSCEKNKVEPPRWTKQLAYVSVFWAFSIHTVTAFLYAGLPGRHYWLTAILAARFLASAFCSGPAILLLMALCLRRLTDFDPSKEAVKALSTIIAYAMGINVFFYLLEIFTAFYSRIPDHMHPFAFLFSGHDGHWSWITAWMWAAAVCGIFAMLLLFPPSLRRNEHVLPFALVLLVVATWIDKGLGMLIAGFTPNAFNGITPYIPSWIELCVSLGIYALGLLILSLFWKIVLEVKKETGNL